jgi:uncharacterized protein involved in exopolysaccharide biosynthesis
MKSEIGIARLWGVVRRRPWVVGATAALAAALGIAWVAAMPATYEATAVVRIDDPSPSREYVPPTVNEPQMERLKSARRAILARPLVESAAEQAGLLDGKRGEARERAVAEAALRLDARAEGDDSFVVTYEDHDPARARTFLSALTRAYAESRAKEMREQADATALFFGREVTALKPRVADAEAVVEAFRLTHHGALPEQLDGNLRILDELQLQLATLQVSLDAALDRRRELLSDAASPLRRQEEDVASALSQARVRFAQGAPEVASLESELARVRAAREADEEELARKIRRSPELRTIDDEVDATRALMKQLEGKQQALVARIDITAKHGEELARLALERDVLRARLRSLMEKHEEAELAAGLEAGVAGAARIAVVEPAWATTAPVKPARLMFALIALALALALALGVGLALDALDGRVRGVEDVRPLVGDVPVLGIVRGPAARRVR